jgi:predicted metal-dependent peptidase
MNPYEHLQKAKCRLIMKEPFYGTVTMQFEFKETTRIPTMGVRIVNAGVIQALYNPEFITSLSIEQLYSLLIHECEHIIRLHPVRIETRNHDGWNVAADMSINGKRSNPTCAYKEEGKKPIVVSEDGCFIPEKWDSNKSSEVYYEMLPKCEECGEVLPWDHETGEARELDDNCGGSGNGEGEEEQDSDGQGGGGDGEGNQEGQGQGQGQGQNDDFEVEACSGCGRIKININGNYKGKDAGGKSFDDHSTWSDSDVSEDEARQIVKQITDQASSNCQGNVPGHLKEHLEALNKPVVRWREIIRRFLGRHAGGCRKTYSRRNRRFNTFGLKGNSHHAVATLGVIIDTSGSIGTEELKQFFAEIESISSKTNTWVLQWDTHFGSYQKRYRRGDWKTIEIVGRGGTCMDESQNWVVENNIPAEAVIMLTDGYTAWREEPMPMPFFICLTTPESKDNTPEYAETIVMPNMK